MAQLLSLPSEILSQITSYVIHPPHLLHLALTCQRLRSIVLPALYTSITIRHENYYHWPGSPGDPLTTQPTTITLLRDRLRMNPSLGTRIRSLNLRLYMHDKWELYGLDMLLPHTPQLAHLSLEVFLAEERYFSQDLCFPAIAECLRLVKDTLESLYVSARASFSQTGARGPIGSLEQFTALKTLALPFETMQGPKCAVVDSVYFVNNLPPNLEALQVECVTPKRGYPQSNSMEEMTDVRLCYEQAIVCFEMMLKLKKNMKKKRNKMRLPRLRVAAIWLPDWKNSWQVEAHCQDFKDSMVNIAAAFKEKAAKKGVDFGISRGYEAEGVELYGGSGTQSALYSAMHNWRVSKLLYS